jgi:CDP-glucose 4,6-dehydratase
MQVNEAGTTAATSGGRLPFERALAGQSVLVTGHTGFTGGWLCLWLQAIGCRVTGVALAPATTPNIFDAAGISSAVTSVIADIRDLAGVERALAASQPAIVFHLAAQPLVSRAFDDPLETLATNVLGTAHVLEAARRTQGVKGVVCVTTDKVYADQNWPWGYRESDSLGGKDPYSASKACAELVAASYRATLSARGNGVQIVTARGGNIIGGGDWSANRIVPDFVRALESGLPLTLRNPEAVRPWQHVMALAHGYMVLAAHMLADSTSLDLAWNFGPRDDEAMAVATLVDRLGVHWRSPEIRIIPGGFPETSFLHLDSAKARGKLGWRPPIGFEETVALTIDWYRRFAERPTAAREITRDQIEGYRAALLVGK